MAVLLVSSCGGNFAVADTAHRPPKISIAAKNESLQSVLLRLAKQSGANISVSPSVTGYVTISLHDVMIRQALEAILAPLGDTWRLRDGIYLVDAPVQLSGGIGATSGVTPAVLMVSTTSASRVADQIRPLFPQALIRVDVRSNALVVLASPQDLQAMRTVIQGIDVRNPTSPVTQAFTLQNARAGDLVRQLHASFPGARIAGVGAHQILISAVPADLNDIKSAITALDAPPALPTTAPVSTEAVKVLQRSPAEVAASLSRQVHGLQASVSGSTVVLTGTPDAVSRAKALVAQIDVPSYNSRYTVVYRIRTVDATSVADLFRRSFHDLDISVDTSINAIAVTASTSVQQRIADAVTQLDPAPGSTTSQGVGPGGMTTELVTLRAAVPSSSGGSGPDATAAMTQALQAIVPDVKVIQLSTPGQLALVGPAPSLRIAREFIDKVDVVPPLVVLDTEILELDESVAKNLGVQLGTAVLSSTFTESTPPPNPTTGLTPALGGLNAFGRTPLSFTAQLNLAIQTGKGRVLADPRISTLSGRTASIRAGDTISILTTTAGNAGTIATTQVQSFQTGVTLDITPLVDADGGITVNLHPVVNSLAGTNNGVPEISTRDTQTTVHLQNDQTLVIGGLIQQTDTRTTNKVPVLGDLPLLGHLFRNDSINGETNELVIVVTPHIVKPGDNNYSPGPSLPKIPTPGALPTIPPNAVLPPRSSQSSVSPLAFQATPMPSASPVSTSVVAPPSPNPAPTAFGQTNVFTFGAAPQSNFAKPGDAVQIFYATLSPTVVSSGSQISISAITTSNAASVHLQLGNQNISLSQTNPGQWRAVFPYPAAAAAPGQSAINATLMASRSDGGSANIPIPISVSAP